ncbi:MAG: hypothetical protein LBF27_25550 [Sphingobacterium sp.]|jgi:hypothetical protein|nr:hypothetical protein [Sphingobacterium sp.]
MEVFDFIKKVRDNHNYSMGKCPSKEEINCRDVAISNGLIKIEGKYYIVTDIGVAALKEFNTFQEWEDYLARDRDIDKKVKTSTISNNVWSIRIAALGVIISMLIAAIPIWVNNQESKEIRVKLDSLSSEVNLLKKINAHRKDSIKELATQKYNDDKNSRNDIATKVIK